MPRITGIAEQGQQLVGSRGTWRNAPTRFGYSWLRCDRAGASCGAIPGARGVTYSVLSADVGRVRVKFDVDPGEVQPGEHLALAGVWNKEKSLATPTFTATGVLKHLGVETQAAGGTGSCSTRP